MKYQTEEYLRKRRDSESRRYKRGKSTCGKAETVRSAGMKAEGVAAEKPEREKRRYERGKSTCGKAGTVKSAGMKAGSVPAEKSRR